MTAPPFTGVFWCSRGQHWVPADDADGWLEGKTVCIACRLGKQPQPA